MIVNFRPRPFVYPEVVQAFLSEGRFVGLKRLIGLQIAVPHLLQEQVIDHLCRFD